MEQPRSRARLRPLRRPLRDALAADRGAGLLVDGALRGKDAIRPYWSAGISTATPPLHFELIDAYGGVDTVAIHYRSVGRKLVVEILELDAHGHIIRGCATHGAAA